MNSTSPALDPADPLIDGEYIDADLRLGGAGRTRRKMIADGRLPVPDGYVGGRARWRLSRYLAARERLLASGRPRRPGQSEAAAA